LRKRIGIDLLCTTLLLDFVIVWLINGGMDRQSIGIIPVLLVLGTVSVNGALLCMAPYLIIAGFGGLLTRGVSGQNLTGLGMLIFLLTYFAVLCWLTLATHTKECGEAAQDFST
jgi:hypothetical protein